MVPWPKTFFEDYYLVPSLSKTEMTKMKAWTNRLFIKYEMEFIGFVTLEMGLQTNDFDFNWLDVKVAQYETI